MLVFSKPPPKPLVLGRCCSALLLSKASTLKTSSPLQAFFLTLSMMAMASSRRFLFTSSILRVHRIAPAITSSSSQPLLSNSKPSLSKSYSPTILPHLLTPTLHFFHRYNCSSATAVETPFESVESTAATSVVPHPWPEWMAFVNVLKSKGYFTEFSVDESSSTVDGDDDGGESAFGTSRNDLNKLKNACLDFARERYDILKLLSREDIQTVVECGCPNLFRKAVNSAKRLRAFVKLDEGEVCSACNLRGSCDRAYVILKDDAAARTVDIVRMLLIYALDPVVLSGEKPHGKEQVEASARKLLSELIELSDKSPDPALPKPVAKPRKEQSEKMTDGELPRNVEMKRGDWICTKCNFMNFSRNIRCRECKEEGPKKVGVDEIEMKQGDWNCPQCQFMNFARNTKCLRCRESRPKRQLNPGEWECPSCDFLNYRRNMACKKCECERPKDNVARYEDEIWRHP